MNGVFWVLSAEANMIELDLETHIQALPGKKSKRLARVRQLPPWMPLVATIFSLLEYPLAADGDPHVISAQKIDAMPSERQFS